MLQNEDETRSRALVDVFVAGPISWLQAPLAPYNKAIHRSNNHLLNCSPVNTLLNCERTQTQTNFSSIGFGYQYSHHCSCTWQHSYGGLVANGFL